MRNKKKNKKYLKQSLQDWSTDKNTLIKGSPNAFWFQEIQLAPRGTQGETANGGQ